MTLNPYVSPEPVIISGDPVDLTSHIHGGRLDAVAWVTVVTCSIWFGFLVLGRLLDKVEMPLYDVVLLYGALGVAPAAGLLGALSTLKRKRYPLCVIGAVCLMLPLFGPWCGLTIPLGAWSLWLLRRPSVRESFRTAQIVSTVCPDSADDAIARAAQLDRDGQWEVAMDVYRQAAERWPEHAHYIDNCMTAITRKQKAAK